MAKHAKKKCNHGSTEIGKHGISDGFLPQLLALMLDDSVLQ